MKKKILVTLSVVACALLLVVGSVVGTLAYLTSTATVTNTFTVGKVAITLDEAKVDEYGVAANINDRVDGSANPANTYKLIPGHTYTKDPVIHVKKGSEECYLFVKVVDGLSTIGAPTTIEQQLTNNGWMKLDSVANVWYHETVDARTATADVDVKVFETFTIANNADVSGYVTANNDAAVITVTAYAVQADGFEEKTAKEIWIAAGFN